MWFWGMWTGNWQQERKPSLARQHLMATLTVLFWRLIIICSIPGFPSPFSHLFPSPVSLRCLWDVTCKLYQSSSFLIPSFEEPERGQNIIGCNFPVNHVKIVKCRVNNVAIQLSTKFRESFFTIRDPYYAIRLGPFPHWKWLNNMVIPHAT